MNTAPVSEFSFSLKNTPKNGAASASQGSMFSGLKRNALAVLGRFHIYSTPCIVAVECLPGVDPFLAGQNAATD